MIFGSDNLNSISRLNTFNLAKNKNAESQYSENGFHFALRRTPQKTVLNAKCWIKWPHAQNKSDNSQRYATKNAFVMFPSNIFIFWYDASWKKTPCSHIQLLMHALSCNNPTTDMQYQKVFCQNIKNIGRKPYKAVFCKVSMWRSTGFFCVWCVRACS